MNFDDAQLMVRGFFESAGITSPGLNGKGFGGAEIESNALVFQFDAAALRCFAVVFRFDRPAADEVIERLMTYDTAKRWSDDRGRLVYLPASLTLAVVRRFDEPVEVGQFTRDLLELVQRASRWANEGIHDAMSP